MILPEQWRWPSVILASTAIVDILVFADIASPVRSIMAIWFLCICPGMALARLLRLSDTWSELALALALSFTLGLGVNMFLMYAGWWSSTTGLVILSVVSVVGAILQLSPSRSAIPAFPTSSANQRLSTDTPGSTRHTPQEAE